jgi:hypothetical protein
MTPITPDSSYEDLIENAREQSRTLGRYAAVVTITRYMADKIRTTVAVSTEPIVSRQRGGEFVGVDAQFHNGQPYAESTSQAVNHPARSRRFEPSPAEMREAAQMFADLSAGL